MLVAIIAEKTVDDLLRAIKGCYDKADVFELRLDYLDLIDWQQLKFTRQQIKKPIIITLRSACHGGHFQGDEQQRLILLEQMGKLRPDYIDIESHVNTSFLTEFYQTYPKIKLIRSYHNFQETPEDLEAILSALKHPCVSVYKLIGYARSSLDTLRVLKLIKNHSQTTNLVTHCMGELGLASRIIGEIMGNYFCYTNVDEAVSPAPGVLTLDTMINIYRIKQIDSATKVLALLGSPVDKSVGHLFHNKKLDELKKNVVYVKIKLTESELSEFFQLINDLPFCGFSVTMPLKQAIIPFIDQFDEESKQIGAINTIRVKEHQYLATNTDGKGAIDAIEEKRLIKNQRVLILGAGGAAKAIAYECKKRNASVITIVNRTYKKAQKLAELLENGKAYDFITFRETVELPYDIIINTLPENADPEPIFNLLKSSMRKQTLFMAINYASEFLYLQQGIKKLECLQIPANIMFVNQALRQLNYWFD